MSDSELEIFNIPRRFDRDHRVKHPDDDDVPLTCLKGKSRPDIKFIANTGDDHIVSYIRQTGCSYTEARKHCSEVRRKHRATRKHASIPVPDPAPVPEPAPPSPVRKIVHDDEDLIELEEEEEEEEEEELSVVPPDPVPKPQQPSASRFAWLFEDPVPKPQPKPHPASRFASPDVMITGSKPNPINTFLGMRGAHRPGLLALPWRTPEQSMRRPNPRSENGISANLAHAQPEPDPDSSEPETDIRTKMDRIRQVIRQQFPGAMITTSRIERDGEKHITFEIEY